MLATTAPTLFEGSTATSSAYAATADSPVTDAISLQRKTGSGVGTLDSLTALTAQPVLVLTSMLNISFGLQSPQCSLAPGNHSTITGWREARNGGAIATIDTFVTIVIA